MDKIVETPPAVVVSSNSEEFYRMPFSLKNSWSWLWVSEEMRVLLENAIAEESDEKVKRQCLAEAKTYNRDIMYTGWNIIVIEWS